MNIAKLDESTIKNSKKLIRRVLSASIDNPNNPESLNFFQADTYRFYFLMSQLLVWILKQRGIFGI